MVEPDNRVAGTLETLTLLGGGLTTSYWTVVLDVVLVALIFYSVYLLLQETRAMRILYGVLILAVIYLVGQALNLTALNFLLQSVFAVTLVAIPVVFQPELRAALERIGRGEIVSSLLTRSKLPVETVIQDLGLVLERLAARKTGALVVVERQTGLKDLAQTGVRLDARLSPELLMTIFHEASPLHDGAVLVRGDRVVAASVFLPITDERLDLELGTRHRAALALSKETDAIVLVVSEETGKISLAVRGKLNRGLDRDSLDRRLSQLLVPQRKDA